MRLSYLLRKLYAVTRDIATLPEILGISFKWEKLVSSFGLFCFGGERKRACRFSNVNIELLGV